MFDNCWATRKELLDTSVARRVCLEELLGTCGQQLFRNFQQAGGGGEEGEEKNNCQAENQPSLKGSGISDCMRDRIDHDEY